MNKITKYTILFFCFLISACEADQIGFLDIRNIAYPETIVIFKSTLDPDNPDDARRIQYHIPWQTLPVEGVEASTIPVYNIERIDTEKGDKTLAIAQFTINPGSGVISLPWDHSLPVGEYTFSIGVSNEKRANFKIAESIITVIIQ